MPKNPSASPCLELPKPKVFLDSILLCLGKQSGCTETPIPLAQVIPAILSEAGFSQSEVPPEWLLLGAEGVPLLHCRVRWAVKRFQDMTPPLIARGPRGCWALTSEGILAAKQKLSLRSVEKNLGEALLKAVGRQSAYTSGAWVLPEKALQSALVEYGADLKKNDAGLCDSFRAVQQKLVAQGMLVSTKTGCALTETGLSKAILLRDTTPNATARWIEANWTLLQTEARKEIFRSLHRSAVAGEADDLINDKVAALIKRNSLLHFLERKEGRQLPTIKNVVWMIRSGAYSRIRGYGVDAHTRTVYGALTERGLAANKTWQKKTHGYVSADGKAIPPAAIHYPSKVLAEKSTAYFVPSQEDMEFVDPRFQPETLAVGQDLFERSEAVIRNAFGNKSSYSKYLRVWNSHFLKELTAMEIATEWQVSDSGVSKCIRDIKGVLKKAILGGALEAVAY